MLSFKIDIAIATATSLPVVTIQDVTLNGTAFNNTPAVSNQVTASVNAYLGGNSDYLVENFWANQGALEFKTNIDIINLVRRKPTGGVSAQATTMIPELFDNITDKISFRFLNFLGYVKSGNKVNDYSNIKLQVTLIA